MLCVEVCPTAISMCANIPMFPGCVLLQYMISQRGSQKLLHRLVSQELTAYISDIYLFFE